MEGEELPRADDRRATTSESDAALMGAVAVGDRGALASLYDRHGPLVLGLAKRMLGPGAAEDLLHDVFLEVWHHAADYSPARGSVRAWLLVRARSRALDRLGRRGRDARVAEDVSVETSLRASGGQTSHDGRHVDARRAEHLAQQLSPDLAGVLDLAYFEGLTCSEIAGRLALPIGTVKSRLARALSQLRQAMGYSESGEQHD